MVPFYLKTFSISLLEIKKLVRPFGISKDCLSVCGYTMHKFSF